MSQWVKISVGVVVLVFVVFAGRQLLNIKFSQPENKNMEKVFLTTEDNVKIAGAYWPAADTKAVILVHQFGRDRESWGSLPGELNQAGFTVLAIDLRGHGDSDLKYSSFGPADFNKMILDIKIARDYLAQQGKTNIMVIGSSIGANLAIMSVGESLAGRAVALSPGIDFKGLSPEKDAKLIAGADKILLISAEDDSYSYESTQMFGQIMGPASKTLNYERGGHGISLLASQADLVPKIIDFLNK